MLGRHRRADGLFRSAVDADGDIVSDDVDLYDQAFVLLALAAMFRAGGATGDVRAEARALVGRLREALQHPTIGFEEAQPRRLPLRANPHMHLLEASLAWVAAGEGDVFADVARELVRLACDHFIDAATGAIGEWFDGAWQPMPGGQGEWREPGHQFEWAVLLAEAGRLLDLDLDADCARLYAFAARHGVVNGRVIAITDASGAIVDCSSRLWQQTERLRAALLFDSEDQICASLDALARFLPGDHPGWWIDRLAADGRPVVEAAPASSLYHLVTGLTPLIEAENG